MKIITKNMIAAIIGFVAVVTVHLIEHHRDQEVKPVGQGFHCVKLFDIKTKFNVVLACNEITN